MTFMSGSNITGIYSGYTDDCFYLFNYTFSNTNPNITSKVLLNFSSYTRGVGFSPDNTKLVLLGYGYNITLYSYTYIANCITFNSSGSCTTCLAGYYSPALNCSY